MTEEAHLQIVPYIPIIVAIISAIGIGLFAAHNRRKGNVEIKAPSVAEAWEQAAAANSELDLERSARRWFENAFWKLVDAFAGYVARVTRGGSTDLLAHEQRALDAKPPKTK